MSTELDTQSVSSSNISGTVIDLVAALGDLSEADPLYAASDIRAMLKEAKFLMPAKYVRRIESSVGEILRRKYREGGNEEEPHISVLPEVTALFTVLDGGSVDDNNIRDVVNGIHDTLTDTARKLALEQVGGSLRQLYRRQ